MPRIVAHRPRTGRLRLVERVHQPIGMGSIQSRPRKPVMVSLGSLDGSSLGDDAPTDPIVLSQQQLAVSTQTRDAMNAWNVQDKKLRLIQIAVTASIPLFAAIWRGLLGWRRSRVQIL